MMDELRELYQEVILDHSKHPRNFGKLTPCTHHADGNNPICGDHITLTLNIQDDQIEDIKFEGSGCAISMASSSIMTDIVKNLSIASAKKLFEYFQKICTEDEPPLVRPEVKHVSDVQFTKMDVLRGVRQFPMRVKCATLAWHTLLAALEHVEKTTTE